MITNSWRNKRKQHGVNRFMYRDYFSNFAARAKELCILFGCRPSPPSCSSGTIQDGDWVQIPVFSR